MIEACIFDLDGVIVDTAKYHYQAWNRLAAQLDITFTEEDNERMKGISRVASLERLLALGQRQYNQQDKDKFCHAKNVWYLNSVSDMNADEILPGVSKFIASIKKERIKVALGSASKNARTILKRVNLTDQFEVIVDGNDVIKSKPDPEVFIKGAHLLGAQIKHTVVFEDSAKGIDAAIAGGFKTVGLGNKQNLGHADLVFKSFEDFSIEALRQKLF